MIHFIQIDSAGRILRSGSAPFRHLKDLPGANGSFRRVPHPVPDPNAFYWDGGLVAVPAAPSAFHRFDVARAGAGPLTLHRRGPQCVRSGTGGWLRATG
nr:hypothetical protein [Delftia acidovorans]